MMILTFLTGVWCPWWHYGLYPNALRKLCSKFGWIVLSLKASRNMSKIDDISRILAGVDDDFDIPDWGWCPWWHYGWSANALRELCLKFGWNLVSLRHQEPCQRWMTFQEFLVELDDDFDVPDWGWCHWWHYGWFANALGELCLKFGWNPMNLKASRTLSKIDDISGILAGDDDDFGVPDLGWCPWWHYGWSANALRELCLKFGWNPMSLKASRTLSMMDDIAGGLEDAGCSWLGLVALIMIGICPWKSLESLFKFWWSSDDCKLRYVELKLRSDDIDSLRTDRQTDRHTHRHTNTQT